ncbi:hypothetical protein BHE90_006881 [Fusarium euwallaceae]|uniref:Uncharacterized protein n=2 Tax=Fusarium solani species complex TaxID=232080 RepID=A0A428S4S0_9HYPO|nr:hypothetical protein CEP52_016342 [Fusarium oligoseptatum]RTE78619.1 hypothetical protein BHE90_006881 [Fusarium euwallaceae]
MYTYAAKSSQDTEQLIVHGAQAVAAVSMPTPSATNLKVASRIFNLPSLRQRPVTRSVTTLSPSLSRTDIIAYSQVKWDSLTLRIDIAEPQFLANAPRK